MAAILTFTAFFKFFADAYPLPATPLNPKSSTRLRSLSLPSCAIMGWAKLSPAHFQQEAANGNDASCGKLLTPFHCNK